MRIALAQLNYHIGNFEHNVTKIKDCIVTAKQQGADLVVFAELAISGYPPRDFLEFDDFIARCLQGINDIASICHGVAAVVGGPSINPRIEGKNLFNTAFYLADGQVQSTHYKGLLPTYDIFDEYRYFEPAREFHTVEVKGKKVAITICEDLWDVEEDLMYTIQPMDELMPQGVDVMVNIAASPFSYDHAEQRKKVLQQNVERYGVPLVYVNHVGAQTELLFDGGSLAYAANGELVAELQYFEEDLRIVDLDEATIAAATPAPSKIALIHDALVMGVRDYFQKLGFKQAILGLSGGIDSAVTLTIAARALGHENVKAVLMPSQYSSDHSISDAMGLVDNLQCPHEQIPIKEMYTAFEQGLLLQFEGTNFDVTEENIQARIRGVLLMALSNKFGHILLNTSNKSEAAVGYGTLYGDMCGGLSVLGDVYKTEVFALARYINRDGEVIPENTITKPPSAELRPDQKDADSLPDYEVLDEILFQYIERKQGPQAIIAAGFDEALVKRVLKLVNTNEYKRFQTPPILRVSNKAFGMGRRMPIVGKYLS